jgi:hypothetical protein
VRSGKWRGKRSGDGGVLPIESGGFGLAAGRAGPAEDGAGGGVERAEWNASSHVRRKPAASAETTHIGDTADGPPATLFAQGVVTDSRRGADGREPRSNSCARYSFAPFAVAAARELCRGFETRPADGAPKPRNVLRVGLPVPMIRPSCSPAFLPCRPDYPSGVGGGPMSSIPGDDTLGHPHGRRQRVSGTGRSVPAEAPPVLLIAPLELSRSSAGRWSRCASRPCRRCGSRSRSRRSCCARAGCRRAARTR